ncbi:ankyrin repeat domain-containing protein [Stenotrophomonas maltophilia]|uniref:ankyrin repeat domain-containing protein n=1 Tax=Stenotrophomonas maltophilia TaxID=40324 RepID=UPI0007877481|nr:ankyrin repeat domain-containing protein [Stenotrophomonas maltophilia]KYK41006.1 hypothetical protein AYX08_05950 [Stenotrophomonas maltophilia]
MYSSTAQAMGYSDLYRSDGAFRERFDEMCVAVDALPPELKERGRALGYPQLHNACVLGELDLVKALLATGLDPDAYTYTDGDDDQPPLVWIAGAVDLDHPTKILIAEALIVSGASVEEGEPRQEAEDAGDHQFAAYLASKAAL